jgi:hypothetical protein
MKSTFDLMMAWEGGKMTAEEYLHLFSALIENGQAWTLQGMYGREATSLIDAGLITKTGKITKEGKAFIKNNKDAVF